MKRINVISYCLTIWIQVSQYSVMNGYRYYYAYSTEKTSLQDSIA